MDFRRLNLESLSELDGGTVPLAFDACVMRAGHDCEDRPFDVKPRVITMKVEITPKLKVGANGARVPDGVKVQVFVDDKMPVKHTSELHMHIDHGSVSYDRDNTRDSSPTLGFGREKE
jgi:hypothetical protein